MAAVSYHGLYIPFWIVQSPMFFLSYPFVCLISVGCHSEFYVAIITFYRYEIIMSPPHLTLPNNQSFFKKLVYSTTPSITADSGIRLSKCTYLQQLAPEIFQVGFN
jgi:hypothetical protein